MPRLTPLPERDHPEMAEMFDVFRGTLGFVPNSMRILQRRPEIVKAFANLNRVVMQGSVDPGLKRLVGHFASRAAGCQYCMAHTAHGAHRHGIDEAKMAAIWDYQTSDLFSPAERAALDIAAAAAQVPNAVTDAMMDEMKRHWREDEIVEILAVVAMFGFLNRWNDTMATPLEPEAEAAGDAYLSDHGWTVGKHR